MQVLAVLVRFLVLLDDDPVGFRPRVLPHACDLPGDSDSRPVGADGELVVPDLAFHRGQRELSHRRELDVVVAVERLEVPGQGNRGRAVDRR